jgi:hypothetical protein
MAGLLFLLGGVLVNSASAAEPDAAKEPVTWNGVIKDDSLRDLAPKEGYIADQETWANVWRAWKPKAELPEVDFTKEIVLVTTVPGPNRTMGRPMKDDEGNVTFRVASTKMAGPGFGYMLARISTEGVKTINGKPFDPTPKATVTGTMVLPKDLASFDSRVVEIRLYKIHPLLADAPATLVDKVEIEGYSHTLGTETKTDFVIGGKEKLEPNLMYYVTLFILQDGKRTHIGEVPGKFMCKVLTNGEPNTVDFKVREVR